MISLNEHLYSDKNGLNKSLSRAVAQQLEAAITARGKAILVVSGGRTPGHMLEMLSQQRLDWKNVTILLADERWVSPLSERSNERMVRERLLQNEASAAPFKSFYSPASSAEDRVASLNKELGFLTEGIDVLLLGMGEDGHTASLFPCANNTTLLFDKTILDKVVVVEPAFAPDKRISLTFPVLIGAGHLYVHMTGEMKKEILQKIISGMMDVPIGHVLQNANGRTHLYWAP